MQNKTLLVPVYHILYLDTRKDEKKTILLEKTTLIKQEKKTRKKNSKESWLKEFEEPKYNIENVEKTQ